MPEPSSARGPTRGVLPPPLLSQSVPDHGDWTGRLPSSDAAARKTDSDPPAGPRWTTHRHVPSSVPYSRSSHEHIGNACDSDLRFAQVVR